LFRTLAAAVFVALVAAVAPQGAHAQGISPALYQGLRWRMIGPLRGGRTVAATGSPNDPNLFYIGAVNGGIWKSDDAGRTWTPIFDNEPSGSIGAIAVAWSDPNVIYAGSGEGLQRPDLAVGDGIYKSTDGGLTWRNVGLRDAQQIGSMAVDPHDPDRVFVAALGHPYGPNAQRGVFRSTDGGATWQRVLYTNPNTGAFAVTIDPNDSKTVYATLWAARQAPWEIGASFEIPGSGLYKSTDGGTTWTQLGQGLPSRIGRTEVAVAPSDSQIVYVYADVEAKGDDNGAVYRSDDAGAHFTKLDDAANIGERGDDLVSLAVDPHDPNTVYLTNTSTYKSTDGGRSFAAWKGAPGGDDYHTVWVNPTNSNIILLASDQGAVVSVNGGRTWSSWYNQPTAQMYHVNATNGFPYYVCGGQQESGSACVSSRGPWGEITTRDWFTAGAEEYGYVVPDPLHEGIFFGGKIERFEKRTGEVQEVAPDLLGSRGYRVVRTEPLAFDRFDKRVLYFGSNVVWSTSDGGYRWKQISPDLTRAHPAVPPVIAAFESDDPQDGKHRGVVYAIAPSYRHEGTIWAGTDDGQVWITRDGGAHWANITPPGLSAWSKISQIDAGRFDDRTAYVAVNRIRLDDLHPYVYVTHDGGAHWRLAVNGLPMQPVNAVREDPQVPNLLYAATENGVAVSFDDGGQWQSLQNNLPHTSARDLIVHQNDAIVATHGRGFWILDDVEPLRELARGGIGPSDHLFAPSLAYRVRRSVNTDTPLPPDELAGVNPPDGAILDYWLARPADHVAIGIFDSSGRLVREFSSDDRPPAPIPDLDKPSYWEADFQRPSPIAGAHRFVWDLREPAPHCAQQDLPISAVPHRTPRVPQGPLVVPGRYRVVIDIDGKRQARDFEVAMDPRIAMSQAQLREQYELAHQIAALMDRTYARKRMALNLRLATLLDVIDGVDAPPTTQALAAFAQLEREAAAKAPPSAASPGGDEP